MYISGIHITLKKSLNDGKEMILFFIIMITIENPKPIELEGNSGELDERKKGKDNGQP